MLSIPAQLLRLCVLAGVASAALAAVRGLPTPPPPPESVAEAACGVPEENAQQVHYIRPEEAHELAGQSGIAFVDCRPRSMYETGHVAGSVHVDAQKAERDPTVLAPLLQASTLVTYCDADSGCERSMRVATLLAQVGAKDVRVLEGGLPAWVAAGFPAESGECSSCGSGEP